MSKKITLKQMETELHEWGGVYVDRVMRGNDKANRYEVNDPDGKRVAIGFERREVLETAYAEMQSRNAQAPTETPASEAPAAPQVEAVAGDNLKAPFPKFTVGQLVEAYGYNGKVTDVRQIDGRNEYCFENSFPSNAWFWESEIIDFAPKDMNEERLYNRITKLEAQLQKAERVAAAFDSELGKEQQKRIKLEADLSAAQAIIRELQSDLKLEKRRSEEALSFVHQQLEKAQAPTPAQEAPTTPKRPVPTRCRVNWNNRGFSSGSYDVLGFSQEKQAYSLNISSDPNRPMPKMVKMADCAVQS